MPSDGDVLTWNSALANNQEWAAGGGPGGTFAGCRVKLSTAGSINNNSVTVIDWDAEDFDTDAFHDNSTNPSRIIIPTGLNGKYLVSVLVGNFFVGGGSSAGRRFITLKKNGSNYQRKEVTCPSSGECWIDLSVVDTFADADYLQVDCYQSSGFNGAVISTNVATDGGIAYFGVTKLD